MSYVLTRLIMSVIDKYCRIARWRFISSFSDVEAVQRKKLAHLLKLAENSRFGKEHHLNDGICWEKFRDMLPITDYTAWEGLVNEQRDNGGRIISGDYCGRYQPTSGSTSRMKWIPYTDAFLSEINTAITQMFGDHMKRERRILKGRQYWSLSWIPTDLRKKIDINATDDMKLLPLWKRIFVEQTLAVPNRVSYAATSDGSMMANLAYLAAARDLVFISVWSPTFALNMFEQMRIHREELAEILAGGKWGRWHDELSFLICPRSPEVSSILKKWDGKASSSFFRELWPGMGMVSSWATSTSSIWAKELSALFPDATFQGKGLWATEGVVTIPFEGKFPLAVLSHFYEFADVETGDVYPAWGLEKGQVVRPVLTTGSGFFRYDLKDRVRVSGFIGKCPCFEFLGRTNTVDMVGEKLSPEIALNILQRVSAKYGVLAVSLLGITGGRGQQKPYYVILCESENSCGSSEGVSGFAEELLLESFHYKLARDLNQLGPARSFFHPEARKLYMKRGERKGMVLGDMKIEPLLLWEDFDLLGL